MVRPTLILLVMMPVTANVMRSPLWAVGNSVRSVPGSLGAPFVTTRIAAWAAPHVNASEQKLTSKEERSVRMTAEKGFINWFLNSLRK